MKMEYRIERLREAKCKLQRSDEYTVRLLTNLGIIPVQHTMHVHILDRYLQLIDMGYSKTDTVCELSCMYGVSTRYIYGVISKFNEL